MLTTITGPINFIATAIVVRYWHQVRRGGLCIAAFAPPSPSRPPTQVIVFHGRGKAVSQCEDGSFCILSRPFMFWASCGLLIAGDLAGSLSIGTHRTDMRSYWFIALYFLLVDLIICTLMLVVGSPLARAFVARLLTLPRCAPRRLATVC